MRAMIQTLLLASFVLSLAACGGTDEQAAQKVAAAPVNAPAAPPAEHAQTVKAPAPSAQQPQPPRPVAADADADADAKTAAEAPRRAPRREWMESLSDAQRDSIKALRERTAERTGAMRGEQRQQQQAFHEALVAGDREAALAASNQLADFAAQSERLRLEELIEMSALLTPEQREQMHAQMRGGQMRGGQMRGGGQMREGRPGEGRRHGARADDGN